MTDRDFYGPARARRSLRHFLLGKGASAILGVTWLIWLVRSTPTADYGGYVALLAFMEFFYLCTGFGLSTLAQRYVAEFRLRAPAGQFDQWLQGLVLRRVVYAGLAAAALIPAWPLLMGWLSIAAQPTMVAWLTAWLVMGSCTRYLDELLPALLLQGVSQALSLVTNVIRLGGLIALWWQGWVPDLAWLLKIEAMAAGICLLLGGALLLRHRRAARHVPNILPSEAMSLHTNTSMSGVARRFYLVQLLGQLWGPNAARLVVARMGGATLVAAYGFCHALVDLLRNYLPAFLLATWVRPLLVARYLEHRQLQPVVEMVSVVFKLSLLMIMPVLAAMPSHGDAIALWVSAGRYGKDAGLLMSLLLLLLIAQALHLCVGMICTTLERADANVQATAACALALPIAVLGWYWLGVLAVPAVLLLAEVAWIGWVVRALRVQGFAAGADFAGCLRIAFSGLCAAAVAAIVPLCHGPLVLAPLLLSTLVVLVVCRALHPFTASERKLVSNIMPLRWLPI